MSNYRVGCNTVFTASLDVLIYTFSTCIQVGTLKGLDTKSSTQHLPVTQDTHTCYSGPNQHVTQANMPSPRTADNLSNHMVNIQLLAVSFHK